MRADVAVRVPRGIVRIEVEQACIEAVIPITSDIEDMPTLSVMSAYSDNLYSLRELCPLNNLR